jgi:hypothetical protein
MRDTPEREDLLLLVRIQRERYIRLAFKFSALQSLLIEKGQVSEAEINERADFLRDQAEGPMKSLQTDEEKILQFLDAFEGPIQ